MTWFGELGYAIGYGQHIAPGVLDAERDSLLAFSCKCRHFCPSCHQMPLVEFREWLCMDYPTEKIC